MLQQGLEQVYSASMRDMGGPTIYLSVWTEAASIEADSTVSTGELVANEGFQVKLDILEASSSLAERWARGKAQPASAALPSQKHSPRPKPAGTFLRRPVDREMPIAGTVGSTARDSHAGDPPTFRRLKAFQAKSSLLLPTCSHPLPPRRPQPSGRPPARPRLPTRICPSFCIILLALSFDPEQGGLLPGRHPTPVKHSSASSRGFVRLESNLAMSGPSYDPLPLTADHRDDVRYDIPTSPRMTGFHTPETEHLELHDDLPPGGDRPRFLGTALRDDGPQPRQSYADSNSSFPTIQDDYSSSVYGLNPVGQAGQARDSSFYTLNYHDDPHDSEFVGSSNTITMNKDGMQSSPYLSEKRAAYPAARTRSRRRWWIIAAVVLAAIAIIVIVVAVVVSVARHKSNQDDAVSGGTAKGGEPSGTASSAASQPSATGKPTQSLAVTGGNGSTVTMDDGTTFTYYNPFGGTWYWDPNDPFNDGAQAQTWSPALNETFQYGIDKIRGVNLGGWLNTEPFIVPALYEKYINSTTVAVDEWTLSQNMANDTANGGLNQLEDHYKTFITEQDFAEIAAAGLNFVRIPLPYWAIEVREGEPFLPKVAWTYFLKAIQWARKYGIRINLDLHALPGSQNGWNHSGRLGSINVLNGPMGLANAQRSLDYIRVIAEFISQPQYKNVVAMFGVTNEPLAPIFGQENLARYYLQAYNIVREASGVGQGNGPFISFHDGFMGLNNWAGYFENSDRTSLDLHPYLCFDGQSSEGYAARATTPCSAWAANFNTSMAAYGLSSAGEFSNAINDCGLWVNGVNLGTRYEGDYPGGPWPSQGSCDPWTDYQTWNDSMKADIQQFALASMDALQVRTLEPAVRL
ncbi:hypothetical protein NM688_g1276 [Phlebia brevispora]|uniref:Uncharacterized protein n=1 Tax=Phlebia brevispora TaxID=194682 RepID=A0ACC1TC24_9APHY|nr:hypothetical protein NM688_g1276 [Phlebia brevispora]